MVVVGPKKGGGGEKKITLKTRRTGRREGKLLSFSASPEAEDERPRWLEEKKGGGGGGGGEKFANRLQEQVDKGGFVWSGSRRRMRKMKGLKKNGYLHSQTP